MTAHGSLRARLYRPIIIEDLAGAVCAMHSARVAPTYSIHRQALHPARFFQTQAERIAATASDQFRQAPSQALRVDAERVAYALK